jgi:hypothetical protein
MSDIDEIKKALSLFGLDFTVSHEDIEEAYKKSIAEYHPDKVSNLGKDIQKLAKKNTGDYEAAYHYLKKHYDPMPLEEVINKLRAKIHDRNVSGWALAFIVGVITFLIGLIWGGSIE